MYAKQWQRRAQVLLLDTSRDGHVSLMACELARVKSELRATPALGIPGCDRQRYHSKAHDLDIVHGWYTDHIAPENSTRSAREADCSLRLSSGNHPLNNCPDTVAKLFGQFLDTAPGG